jgi:glutamate/tyrosine decarboxylase-like PLP-dependent enzyme
VLYQDPEVGRHYKHESPYTYFTSKELHLGEISLECSRAGASAVALWATQRLMPLVRGGTFARGLADSREAALRLHQRLSADRRFRMLFPPELDIVVWAPAGDSASQISERSERLFEAAARENLHLATYRYPSALLRERWPQVHFDRADVVCMRSCLMKAEHKDWLDRIWSALDRAATPILGRA